MQQTSEVLLQDPLLLHIDVSLRVCYNTLELHKQLADAKTHKSSVGRPSPTSCSVNGETDT